MSLPACCRFEVTEVDFELDQQMGVVGLRPPRSTLLEWLRRSAALLELDLRSDDGFAALTELEDFSGAC